MVIERDALVSLLRVTTAGAVSKELIEKDARIPSQVLESILARLSRDWLICRKGNLIEASPRQRLNLAVRAIRLGSDSEQISRLLSWTEFESVAAEAFAANGFMVLRNFRFRRDGRRWEIDLVSCREPLIACVDCKHWRHGWTRAAIIKAVEAQIERTRSFAEALPDYCGKVGLAKWKNATIIPLILSLTSGAFKLQDDVPIVSMPQIQDFINTLPIEARQLKHFNKKLIVFQRNLTDCC